MVSPLRVNRYTKNYYFAPKCHKIRFSHYSSKKKTPFSTKKMVVILFLTLNGRTATIAGLARWKIHHLHITLYLTLPFFVFALWPHFRYLRAIIDRFLAISTRLLQYYRFYGVLKVVKKLWFFFRKRCISENGQPVKG